MLNLPNWEVEKINQTEFDFQVTARYVLPLPHCPGCHHTSLVGFGTRHQLFMDFPQQGKRVGVAVVRRRYKCKSCGKVSLQPLPDMDDSHAATKRLIEYLKKEAVRRTFLALAEEVGLHEKTIRRIFAEYVRQLEHTIKFATPKWMGLDEIFLLRRPHGIITNVKERTILNLLKDRYQKTIESYLLSLDDREAIEVVAMDMWEPYRLAAKSVVPKAQITVDKFHVVRMANNALEAVRRDVQGELDQKKRRTLKHDRYFLLKRRKDLKPDEQLLLETWTLNMPALGTAYDLKEDFFEIWKAKTQTDAVKSYEEWRGRIPPALAGHFKPLTTAMKNWHGEIFSYFNNRVTNAYTESLNNLVRVLNRIGRGYSFEVLRAKILFSEGFRKQRKPKYWDSPILPDGFAMYQRLASDFYLEEDFGVDISTLIDKFEQGLL